MNTLFSTVILLAFIGLFVFLMYKILNNTLGGGSSPSAAAAALLDDTPSDAAAAEFYKVRSSNGVSIAGMTTPLQDMSLRQVIIKASSNTALTGSYVNLNMVTQVISRGCRFLDFQVFIKNNSVVVAYSNATYDPSFTSMTSLNYVSLAGVCSTIMANAFSDTAPNKSDPLFVQFHLKTARSDMYDTIAQILYANLLDKLYLDSNKQAVAVTPDTRLGDLMGRVVVLMDAPLLKTTYASSCAADVTCRTLPSVVNMLTNTPTVALYSEYDLLKQTHTPSTSSAYLYRIVQPTLGFYSVTTNPDVYGLVQNYSTQVVAEAFYISDTNLLAYEQLFDKYKSAFASMSDVIGMIELARQK
jgi:hypothetical protein